ncbi:MAG: glycosyltransferase [Marinicaulis sp.]|nr:glycosyltransferase [Marinicaulis sp.]
MKFLVLTTLFPNAAMPSHGVFVENRLQAFLDDYDAEIRVIAPVPWFPFKNDALGQYAKFARVPLREERNGVHVYHPRYFLPPKIGMNYAPTALARCFTKAIKEVTADGWDFDFVDAHYFYPDGVAAVEIAQSLDKPVIVTARGTDINLIPDYPRPRKKILRAARKADAIVTVAAALKDQMISLGVDRPKIHVLRNGVDLDKFHPVDREAAREKLGLTNHPKGAPVIASVGHLIERKGHDLVMSAIKNIPGATLLIAGDGAERKALAAKAVTENLVDRVRFLGAVDHSELRNVYSAADMLVLASSREGWPNVLLEAMACGAPCVATPVWGSSEVIRAPEAGRLSTARTPEAIEAAIRDLWSNLPPRSDTREYAEQHSWQTTIDGMAHLFENFVEKSEANRATTTQAFSLDAEKQKPRLIVTIDTEEQFDWSSFDFRHHLVNDTADVDKFQQRCAVENIKPLYFLTYPLLADEAVARYYGGLLREDAADAGLHLHQWMTPPGDFSGEFYSFQTNLPRYAYREKLRELAFKFSDALGQRAIAHRAGRYGIAKADYDLLAEAGIKYDFSPSAGFDFSDRGGPDFSGFSNKPFILSRDDWRIAVTPVCGARAIPRTGAFFDQEKSEPGFSARPAKTPFLISMRLSPEGARLSDMKALTRRLHKSGTPVMSFTFHSTSLTAGATDYTESKDDVESFLNRSFEFLNWFRNDFGGEIISLNQLARLYDDAVTKKPT